MSVGDSVGTENKIKMSRNVKGRFASTRNYLLTISWIVDDFGEAVGSVSFHIERLYLHLELSNLEVLLSWNEVGVFVSVSPRLRIRDGLVPPVVSIVGLESHDVAKFFAREKPWLHRLKEERHTCKPN